MAPITLRLDEEKSRALREKAERYGLPPEQFLQASVDLLISQPDPEFDDVVRRVLTKNSELYRRLA